MNGRRWPDPIGPGSVVALVAPSGPLTAERIRTGIDRLESWGLETRPGKQLHDRHRRLDYLAGDDHERAADLMNAWLDP